MEGKFFTGKKGNDRNKNASDDLKKIQLVKYPELPFFIVIKSNAVADIPNPIQEVDDLLLGDFK